MREIKYKIGDIYNNRQLIGFVKGKYLIKCLDCGKETRQGTTEMVTRKCPCSKLGTFTTKPLNKKLSQIRDKYKNGVTLEHLKEWLGG
ncbi:MAG: hypothetical protein IKC11_02875 [Clostridia bacterium]|nr:hypothetical protein [Clostridia bacterium]